MNSTETMSCTMYDKRTGTSGIRGQLYETKLLSLINFRAIHDATIEEFCLATNVDNIGAFDDICFKAKIKGFARPVAVFIQAKHKENDKLKFDSLNDLAKYFDSCLKIRCKFKPSNKDVLFDGHFDETDCLFVMYTSARDGSKKDWVESSLANKLNELIGTGDKANHSYKTDEDVEFLCKIAIKEQIISLAEKMYKFIFNKSNLQMLLDDEVVLRYHVILAQKVIDVFEIQSDGYHNASLREDFFDTNEELFILLKHTLCKLVLKERKLEKTEIEDFLPLIPVFFADPTDVKTLSKLIGIVINYKDGQLEFVDKTTEDSLKQQLSTMYVAPLTVNIAMEMAAKEKLLSQKFKVPAAFGNKDITIQGSDKKIEKRLNQLTLKICELINKSDDNKIVVIDESLENGFLHLYGGIASAVGNILVSDENAKLMKFTDNCESLGEVGDLAKRLFDKLKDKLNNLHEYRFEVKVQKFPKHSLDCSGHDEKLARDFLNNLLFYTNQADESGVEKILKSDMKDYQRNNVNYFQAQTDAIFLTYHDEVQKWWMIPKRASYLTKENKMYENAKLNIVKEPLMCVLNMVYMYKLNDYTFKEDAVESLKLQDNIPKTVIVAESIVLTVVKVIQYVKNKGHFVLDLEYVINLPTNDRNAFYDELKNTDEEKILILVCNKVQNSRNWHNTLDNVANAVYNKNIIIITNNTSVALIKEYFTIADNAIHIIHDTRNNLIDMNDESQKSILKNARVIFQGKEVSLDLIVDEELKALVQGDILNRIISNDTIEVGKSMGNSKYDKMKHLYVDRRMPKQGNSKYDKMKHQYFGSGAWGKPTYYNTLYDIIDDVVLITALPGMGKSTLLTHLSLKTKDLDPKVWIVRINLLEYSRQFGKWRENNTAVGSLETLNFICHVILNEKYGEEEEVSITLEESNGVVYLRECTADQWAAFELKMFLYYFNTQKVIFLFDGFDEICPHYADDVIKCIKIVRDHHRKHRIWIASRPYTEIKSILECEFGASYEIGPFSHDEWRKYLEQFWKSNLILTELDSGQLNNVNDFIEFMSESHKYSKRQRFKYRPEFNVVDLYTSAVIYLIKEIKSSYIPLWKCKTNYDADLSPLIKRLIIGYRNKHNVIPLHLNLMADYFQNEIKSVNKTTDRWNVDISTHTIYELFIETKFKKIRLQEKNKMDIYKPDIMMSYVKERADFFMKHKNLGAYAIFYEHKHALFNMKELKEIEDTIQILKKGEEKTGFICGTANDIPMFIHMTFAEYFAAEYVCDSLKNKNLCEEQTYIIDFIFEVIFGSYDNCKVLDFIDYKLQMDEPLMRVLRTRKKVIFDILMKQGKVFTEYAKLERKKQSVLSLTKAMEQRLYNFIQLFISVFDSNLNENNLNEFLDIVSTSGMLIFSSIQTPTFISFVIDVVRKLDEPKLSLLLIKDFGIWACGVDFDVMSTAEIMQFIIPSVR